MKDLGLYLHIPFCASKCAYCDFYSLSSSELQNDYIDALCKSIEIVAESHADARFTTFYIGGGTPSILEEKLLAKLLEVLCTRIRITMDAEFTLEANPATLSSKKLSLMQNAGVNRLSIGCQSVHENELKRISRIHSFEDFCESFYLARNAGFQNINVDLMYGLPEQTTGSLLLSIDKISSLSPEHISLYGLKIEPETRFGQDRSLILPNEDSQCEMYIRACDMLRDKGYNRYEISNFAKSNKVSRHNLRYWECKEYIGIGAAAHSYINGVRYAYERSAQNYIEALKQGDLPTPCESNVITEYEKLEEFIILSLRLEKGLDLELLSSRFGSHKANLLMRCASRYIPKFMTLKDDRLSFTTEGFLVSNSILSELI